MDLTLPIVLLAAVLLTAILLYNGLVAKRNRVEYAFASIDALLKKRHDLVPNLVAAVRGYMTHEREVLGRLTELRRQAADAPLGGASRMEAEAGIAAGLGTVIARAEAYPELKADQNVLHLQASLTELEEQISAARRFFNAAVTDFNTAVESFPWSLMAGATGMRRKELFEIPSMERRAPRVGGLGEAS